VTSIEPPPPPGSVVRLVTSMPDSPPAELPIPPRMGPTGRRLAYLGCLLATVLTVGFSILLWVSDTPGWWFSALFTVFFAVLCLTFWGVVEASVTAGDAERDAARVWARALPGVVGQRGVLADRHVALSDEGGVSSFDVAIELDDGGTVTARWLPGREAPTLLQPQVPGARAAARVWRDPQTAGAPVVVDLLDPTAAPALGASSDS
jgi:hypothetical protein